MARWQSHEPSRGGVSVSYATYEYVLAPNAPTVHHLHVYAVAITPTQAQPDPQLPNCISTWFRARHKHQKSDAEGGNHWDQHCIVNTRLSLFS